MSYFPTRLPTRNLTLGRKAGSIFTQATSLGGSLVSDATSLGGVVATKVTCMFFPSLIPRARGMMLMVSYRSRRWLSFHRDNIGRWRSYYTRGKRRGRSHHLRGICLYCCHLGCVKCDDAIRVCTEVGQIIAELKRTFFFLLGMRLRRMSVRYTCRHLC